MYEPCSAEFVYEYVRDLKQVRVVDVDCESWKGEKSKCELGIPVVQV